jgi:LysM repeat protein
MSSLKTLVVVLLLAVGAGGVYTLINGSTPTSAPPGATDPLPGPPNVQWAGEAAGDPSMAGGPPAVSFATDQPNSQPPSFATASPPAPSPPPPSGVPPQSSTTSAGQALPSGFAPQPDPGLPAPPLATSTPAEAVPAGLRPPFVEFMKVAVDKLNKGDWVEVLDRLSQWYGDPRLTAEESRRMVDLLDQVAGSVIYSTQSILEPPYRVEVGDTLESIGQKFNVPGELLAKINGLNGPQDLVPGRELKVIHGPFDAVVHVDKLELILRLQGRYAGRFPIRVDCDARQLEGTYCVKGKSIHPGNGQTEERIAASDPRNPIRGARLINLDDQIAIRGDEDGRASGDTVPRGSICLAPRDVEDLYDILSVGSKVVIRR